MPGVALAGMVAATAPLPCPLKLTEPMPVGAANVPAASESCAVIVLPAGKVLPDTAKLSVRASPRHNGPLKAVRVITWAGCTVTSTKLLEVQVPSVTVRL